MHDARAVSERRPHVLVVDDERAFTDLLAELFEQEGYQVDRAYDGAQALRQLGTGGPLDLVVSDIMMPKLSGAKLLDAARCLPATRDLPFLLLSAGRDPGITADRVWFMAKPVDFDQFLGRVKALLDSPPHPANAHPGTAAAWDIAFDAGRHEPSWTAASRDGGAVEAT